eukprot:925013_1
MICSFIFNRPMCCAIIPRHCHIQIVIIPQAQPPHRPYPLQIHQHGFLLMHQHCRLHLHQHHLLQVHLHLFLRMHQHQHLRMHQHTSQPRVMIIIPVTIHWMAVTGHQILFLMKSNVSTYIAMDQNMHFHEQNIHCNQTLPTVSDIEYEACFIGCYDKFSCYMTNIIPVASNRLEQLTLVCLNKYSCHGLTLNVTDDVTIDRMTITCVSRLSCVEVTIHVNVSSASEFALHCNASLSCSDTSITLGNKVNSNIFCYDANACDSMSIHTDHSSEIELNIAVYRYSSNISIDYAWFAAENVVCGMPNDHRFIRYPVRDILHSVEILYMAQKEYASNHLPCSDIEVQCTGDKAEYDDINRQCTMEYRVKPIDLLSILQENEEVNCYWVDLSNLLYHKCHGNCERDVVYYSYDILVVLNVYLRIEEEKMHPICDEYFKTDNDTQITLNHRCIRVIMKRMMMDKQQANSSQEDLLDDEKDKRQKTTDLF